MQSTSLFCLSLCLSVCLSLCLSVSLSLCLSGSLALCLSVSLSLCPCFVFVFVIVHLCLCLCRFLHVSLSVFCGSVCVCCGWGVNLCVEAVKQTTHRQETQRKSPTNKPHQKIRPDFNVFLKSAKVLDTLCFTMVFCHIDPFRLG